MMGTCIHVLYACICSFIYTVLCKAIIGYSVCYTIMSTICTGLLCIIHVYDYAMQYNYVSYADVCIIFTELIRNELS